MLWDSRLLEGQLLQFGFSLTLIFMVSIATAFGTAVAVGAFFVCKCFRRSPWRSIFVMFLLAGVNLEANIAITAGKMEKEAVKRAAEIGELGQNEYLELYKKNEAALKQLPIVASVHLVQAAKLNNSYCRVNLTCTGQCGHEQQPQLRLSQRCPTLAQAAEIVREHLLLHHEGCMRPSELAACPSSLCSSSEANCSSAPVNVFERMKDSQRRAAEHKAATLRLSTAEFEVERAAKRLRSTAQTSSGPAAADTTSTKSIPYYHRYQNWDLKQFMTRMGEVMCRKGQTLH